MVKKILSAAVFIFSFSIFTNLAYSQESWIHPFLKIHEEYNDNIYLTDSDKEGDWITTVSPGFEIKPHLNSEHELTLGYLADFEYFADHAGENSENHKTDADLKLTFNDWHINFNNMFHYYVDQLRIEDTNRIPRTQDHASTKVTRTSTNMDLSLGYTYRLERYRTDEAIGSYFGQALNYRDLERDEHEGELEAALKFWPKTSLLLSGVLGTLEHRTGKKPDSDFFEILTGLRGEPTKKCTVEAKIGYRGSDYDDPADDFEGLVFRGNLTENFTERDSLRLDFVRTVEDTNYQNNAFYENSFINARYRHGFTDRIAGYIDASYQVNYYPTETTEGSETLNRDDNFWSAGASLSYDLTKWIACEIKYLFRTRDSNISGYDYNNNRISIGLIGSF
ncbi:MAG: outer membrane beta-barrel protein [Candidatus Omnitrophota bacterium]